MKTVHYYRVSTKQQGRSGLGLEAQRKTVEAYCASRNANMLAEFTEVESGKNSKRPQLKAAMDYCKLTGATLVVAKVDRLSRNAAFLNSLMDSGLSVAFADMPNADRLVIGIMAQLAQWETEQISKRTKDALAATKARGTKLGGNRGNIIEAGARGRVASAEARKDASAKHAALVAPYIAAAREAGCTSLREIADYLNARHITTAQGGQ